MSSPPPREWRYHELAPDVAINAAAWDQPARELLAPAVVALLARLHRQFEPRRRALLNARERLQEAHDNGALPCYGSPFAETAESDWRVAPVPPDLRTRRVEITGPVNNTRMVINMLSRNADGARADTAMLDFEDSMKPSWANVISGVHNVIGAVNGTLRHETPGKSYRLAPGDMPTIMVRTRGLHLFESNFLVDSQSISAGLFDLVLCFYYTAQTLVASGRTPKYYIPKTEHYSEARWWNDLFVALQHELGLPPGTLRATFLIETLPAAFQIEEILHEIRDHAAGLNVGRWDKIFSDIKVLRNHPDRIMADRATITMQKPWMDNYARRLIKICHERGAYAIGGMSAFTPGATPELRATQTARVIADKAHEFAIGHDGCWVSHPYFITPALAQFTRPNQLDRLLPEFARNPDLMPRGEGPRTLAGLRTNVRVGIAYQNGWNQDIGCVSWDGLMEDLATFEISRAQTWQWLHHGVRLEDGMPVTADLVATVFDEELAKILAEVDAALADAPPAARSGVRDGFCRAAANARRLFLQTDLQPFLSLTSESVSH
jgi:malate synthase